MESELIINNHEDALINDNEDSHRILEHVEMESEPIINNHEDALINDGKDSHRILEPVEMESEPIINNHEDTLITDSKDETETAEVKPSTNGITPKSSIALKKQPDVLCHCPLQCDKKISIPWRKSVYQQFQDIAEHATQNQFIQRHIKIKSIAKRLWEDEIVDKKIQRRVTCKYLIPMSGSVVHSLYYARTLSYDTVKFSLDTSNGVENQKETLNKSKNALADDLRETQTDISTTPNSLPKLSTELNGHHDPVSEVRKAETCDVNSPMSFNDSDSVNTSLDDMNGSEGETTAQVRYIEVCQKAFMNMFGVTEKRIRWQREKLILKSRILAEKKQKELEEIDRTLSLARSLGAGCQPLFALLEKSNCLHLSNQLMGAIEDDVAMVNNFFHNQLWKPEDMMNKSFHVSSLELESVETECD